MSLSYLQTPRATSSSLSRGSFAKVAAGRLFEVEASEAELAPELGDSRARATGGDAAAPGCVRCSPRSPIVVISRRTLMLVA